MKLPTELGITLLIEFYLGFGIIILDKGWSEDPGPSWAGKFPAIFLFMGDYMRDLSIFIDESGDFGDYAPHSPYYIISMVFHDQKENIQPAIDKLNQELAYLGLDSLCIHTGPIIRREEIYTEMEIDERRKIFNKMVAFVRQIDIRYKCFYIEKRHVEDVVEATGKLSKQISAFVRDHYEEILSFDNVKIYYDSD